MRRIEVDKDWQSTLLQALTSQMDTIDSHMDARDRDLRHITCLNPDLGHDFDLSYSDSANAALVEFRCYMGTHAPQGREHVRDLVLRQEAPTELKLLATDFERLESNLKQHMDGLEASAAALDIASRLIDNEEHGIRLLSALKQSLDANLQDQWDHVLLQLKEGLYV